MNYMRRLSQFFLDWLRSISFFRWLKPLEPSVALRREPESAFDVEIQADAEVEVEVSACQTCFLEIDSKRQEHGFSAGDYLRAHPPIETVKGEPGKERDIKLARARHERALRLIEWEAEKASALSPGVVSNDENVRRALKDGEVDGITGLWPAAFNDIRDVGLSVDRCAYSDQETSLNRFKESFARRGKILVGHLEMNAADLRALKEKLPAQDEGECQLLGIFDTAVQDNDSHAEVYCIAHISGKQPYSRLKSELAERFKSAVVLLDPPAPDEVKPALRIVS